MPVLDAGNYWHGIKIEIPAVIAGIPPLLPKKRAKLNLRLHCKVD
jgi:hypothetical protein